MFRKANNGLKTLEELNKNYSINVRLVAQEMEGKLGIFTASAVSKKDKSDIVSWDSGVRPNLTLAKYY